MGKKFMGLDGTGHFWDRAKAWILNQITSAVTAKIAEIVANAPEDLDTLKEIADWISAHANDAAAMNTQITENKNNIATNTNDISAMNTAILANTEAINGKVDRDALVFKYYSTLETSSLNCNDITDYECIVTANIDNWAKLNYPIKDLLLITTHRNVADGYQEARTYYGKRKFIRTMVNEVWQSWQELVTMDELTPKVGFITGNLLSSVITASNLYYQKFGDGRLFIIGWVKLDAVSVGTKLFTLPNDWKASSNCLLPCYVYKRNIACACMINIAKGDVFAYTPIPAADELKFCGLVYLS